MDTIRRSAFTLMKLLWFQVAVELFNCRSDAMLYFLLFGHSIAQLCASLIFSSHGKEKMRRMEDKKCFSFHDWIILTHFTCQGGNTNVSSTEREKAPAAAEAQPSRNTSCVIPEFAFEGKEEVPVNTAEEVPQKAVNAVGEEGKKISASDSDPSEPRDAKRPFAELKQKAANKRADARSQCSGTGRSLLKTSGAAVRPPMVSCLPKLHNLNAQRDKPCEDTKTVTQPVRKSKNISLLVHRDLFGYSLLKKKDGGGSLRNRCQDEPEAAPGAFAQAQDIPGVFTVADSPDGDFSLVTVEVPAYEDNQCAGNESENKPDVSTLKDAHVETKEDATAGSDVEDNEVHSPSFTDSGEKLTAENENKAKLEDILPKHVSSKIGSEEVIRMHKMEDKNDNAAESDVDIDISEEEDDNNVKPDVVAERDAIYKTLMQDAGLEVGWSSDDDDSGEDAQSAEDNAGEEDAGEADANTSSESEEEWEEKTDPYKREHGKLKPAVGPCRLL